MKYLITNKNNFSLPSGYSVKLGLLEIDGLRILCEEDRKPERIEGCFLFNDGYLRDLEKDVKDLKGQEKSVVQAVSRNWPLKDNITGSFSATLLDPEEQQIILCTDQVGLYPLYYLQDEDHFFISNSIILMGAISGSEFDKAGIVQRSLGPEFATLGSRTILKNCKRLLPGEYLRWNIKGELLQQKFDNRLFQQMGSATGESFSVENYWKAFKQEVEYCSNYSGTVNLALSGGIDSRVVLGAIPREKKINCFTYGNPGNYETKIARRLCKLKKGEFHTCYDPDLYFPKPETFREYVQETEAVELCSWLEITESIGSKREEPLLLGELCEALPARNIKSFSGKDFRRKNFLKYFVKKKDYSFTTANAAHFEQWKQKVIHQFRSYYHDRNLEKFKVKLNKEDLLEALLFNLEELFSRLEAHELPYIELYDELFSWYTYTRMHLSKHLLIAGSRFNVYSPAMSLQMLTLTSRIHPNRRLNYRFANELFKKNEDLKRLSKVPTAQAPLVPHNFPDFFKFAMWGIRSTADQFLINKMMKKREPGSRYRLFKSINWAEVYQHPQMEENIKAYFEPNEIGQLFYEGLYDQAIARKELRAWPFANLNIMNAASLNVELNSIRNFRN